MSTIICQSANSAVLLTSESQFISKNDTKKMNEKHTNYWQ